MPTHVDAMSDTTQEPGTQRSHPEPYVFTCIWTDCVVRTLAGHVHQGDQGVLGGTHGLGEQLRQLARLRAYRKAGAVVPISAEISPEAECEYMCVCSWGGTADVA